MAQDDVNKCTPEEAFRRLSGLRLSCNLRVFGSQLGLDASFLDDVENRRDYNERLMCILGRSNDQEQLTWTKIVTTLKQPSLNEHRVVSGLSDPDRNSVSSTRSSRSTSRGESLSSEDKGKFLEIHVLERYIE